MIEALRAKYLPRFLEGARAKMAKALAHLEEGQQGAAGLAATLHSLAGEAGVLGFSDVTELASSTEKTAKEWAASGSSQDAVRCMRGVRSIGSAIRKLETPPVTPPTIAAQAAAASRPVLIVDDSPIVAGQISDALEELGFTVLLASTTLPALELVRARRPQLALVDVHMPNVNEATLCRELRAAATAPLAIHLVSALPDVELAVLAQERGADGFVGKRTGLDGILARVRELMTESPG